MNARDRACLSRVRCLALAAQAWAGARPTRGQVIRALIPIAPELAAELLGLAPWEADAIAARRSDHAGVAADAADRPGPDTPAAAVRGFAVDSRPRTTTKKQAEKQRGATR